MERIVLHTSSRHLYRKLALGLVGGAAGAAYLLLPPLLPHFALLGWTVVAVSGTYALVQLRSLGEDVERVVIDDGGIKDSIYPVGVIGWDEVRGASVQKVGSFEVVVLQLRDPERFIRRLPAVRQYIARQALTAGLPGVYLTLVGTDGDPKRIAAVINERLSGRQSPVVSRQ
jgi:hypothetical protein